jgi:hypothetical protein
MKLRRAAWKKKQWKAKKEETKRAKHSKWLDKSR